MFQAVICKFCNVWDETKNEKNKRKQNHFLSVIYQYFLIFLCIDMKFLGFSDGLIINFKYYGTEAVQVEKERKKGFLETVDSSSVKDLADEEKNVSQFEGNIFFNMTMAMAINRSSRI